MKWVFALINPKNKKSEHINTKEIIINNKISETLKIFKPLF